MMIVSDEVREQLAPQGKLSAAVYLGNVLLVTGRSSAGDPTGISPDICQAIADLLKVKLTLHPCTTQADPETLDLKCARVALGTCILQADI